ncbi:hypothetical protein E7T06_12055 [Deinococcus sp. Arct2-2]|uniref:hypothetical protein n=1 Tax=Deinococcus sp. Arct2-2 TaxID=2568653 RepID=UPI0010A553BA|nr:hypothetical protein [Deinococcus sp. Arct2-2]THF69417.1 hypothetical protein E7T06_12055 [Deinococcus sp. Arct2-2]
MKQIRAGKIKAVALGAALLGSTAGAVDLDFGVAYRTGTDVVGAGNVWQQTTPRVGVSNVSALGGTLSAGISNRAVDAGYALGLSLPPLGAVSSRTDLAVTWQGGLRLSSRATGTAGPVALTAGASVFTTSATAVDPLAAWTFAPTDLRDRGLTGDIAARYRVNRNLVAVLGGEFGAQNQGFLGVESRRDLTRVLAPSEGDDPTLEPATERTGTLTFRAGARAGQDILGVTGGLTYATEAGLSLGLDALVGRGQTDSGGTGLGSTGLTYGLTASVTAPDLLGEGSSIRVYSAYEPWRTASAPLRVGAEASLPLGPGELSLDVRGGRTLGGTAGFGARVGYRLPLGGSESSGTDSNGSDSPQDSTP